MRRLILTTLLTATVAEPAVAQQPKTTIAVRPYMVTETERSDRPWLGIMMSAGSKRDTLGILIDGVTPGSPAEKAGLEEGNRIGAINGVSLKLAREDAGEPEMANAMMNRLTRELRKAKVGDEVTLEIFTGGRYRSVKVKTSVPEENAPARRSRTDAEDRAVIGVSLSVTGSKRDADGVFVSAVTDGGPAEKAGIVEGERIAAINGVSLKIAKEDIEERSIAAAKLDRLQRELAKAKAGDVVELQVLSAGRTRTVKVPTVKASALPHTAGFGFGAGEGGMMRFVPGEALTLPRMPMVPTPPTPPRVRVFRDFDDGLSAEREVEIRAQVERAVERARSSVERMRIEMPSRVTRRMIVL